VLVFSKDRESAKRFGREAGDAMGYAGRFDRCRQPVAEFYIIAGETANIAARSLSTMAGGARRCRDIRRCRAIRDYIGDATAAAL
jgi:hypothetical protein